jgi:plastocyanin
VRRGRPLQLVTIAALVLAGCGDDAGTEEAPAEAEEPAGGSGDTVQVAIEDADGRRFSPAEVTVAAGGTVTWTHEGSLPHTVTAPDGAFDSGTLEGGDTFTFSPQEAGTIAYVCSIHSDMAGTLTVS